MLPFFSHCVEDIIAKCLNVFFFPCIFTLVGGDAEPTSRNEFANALVGKVYGAHDATEVLQRMTVTVRLISILVESTIESMLSATLGI